MAKEIDLSDLYEFLNNNDVIEPIVVSRNGEKHAVVVSYEVFMANRWARRVDETLKEVDLSDLWEHLLTKDLTESRVVSRHGRQHAVVIPYEIFMDYQRANRRVLRVDELSPEDRQALLDAEVTDERPLSEKFNDEMKE